MKTAIVVIVMGKAKARTAHIILIRAFGVIIYMGLFIVALAYRLGCIWKIRHTIAH